MPKPMAMALSRFCTGKTSERAVMADSLNAATNRLSTMLYSELTSMEMTLGSAMDIKSGKTGRSFIKVLFTEEISSHRVGFAEVWTQKSHTMAFAPLCGEK